MQTAGSRVFLKILYFAAGIGALTIAGQAPAQTDLFSARQVIQGTDVKRPLSIFAADIDGDGDMDILSASADDDKIAWYENTDGMGTFSRQKVINIPDPGLRPFEEDNGNADGANAVIAADVDGDGDMDVLSTSGRDDKVAWYENTDGLGSFGPQRVISIPDPEPDNAETNGDPGSPRRLVAADLDGDGDVDLLLIADTDPPSVPDDRIVWYENTDGLGTFGPYRVVLEGCCQATDVRTADFDGDGDLDIISGWVNKIVWQENIDGRGSFGPERPVLAPANLHLNVFLHPADVDGDGDMDVLATLPIMDILAWIENVDGRGNFGPPRIVDSNIDLGSNRVTFVSVFGADFDGDGDMDVLGSHSNKERSITWYENIDGEGTFVLNQIILVNDLGARVIAADLDGDGDVDVAAAPRGISDNYVAWYRNTDGIGTFGPERFITNKADSVFSVFAADLDGDADLDVLAASVSNNMIAWYENLDGAARFGPQQPIATSADFAASVHAADLDGDGDSDVLSGSLDEIRWYENLDGGGAFGPGRFITNAVLGAFSVHAADLDGDGDLDVLSASSGDDKVAWYENIEGLGIFGAQQVISSRADGAASVFAADIDGDDDLDVLSASFEDDTIAWYENTDGLGAFGPAQIITTLADEAISVFAADLDGDGDLDVLSASVADDKIAWYENSDGAGTFGAQRVITVLADGAGSVYAADLDGDGDFDVMSSTDSGVEWYENIDGAGTFGDPRELLSGLRYSAGAVFAADLDADGDQDILSASSSSRFGEIAWFENLSRSPEPTPVPLVTIDFAFSGDEGWQSFVFGDATATASIGEGALAGLCIFSPLPGTNAGVWESPRESAIELVRRSVYRIRFTMSTSQNEKTAQPVWNLLVDNLDGQGRINWGAERWFFANTGFANAIAEPSTQFEAWIVPNPVTTDAWNGVVDPNNSAFDPANLDSAAFNVKFRVLDVEGFPGATTEDQGTICLRSVGIDRFDLSQLLPDGVSPWGSASRVPPQVSVVTLAASGSQLVDSVSLVDDDDQSGTIAIELDEPPATGPTQEEKGVGRAFVRFEQLNQPEGSFWRNFPVIWNDEELLRLTAEIRATSAVAASPVDVIAMGWQTATNELGGFDFSFRGAPGGIMDRAASPRDDSAANSTFTSFFYTHRSTSIDPSLLPDANRLRAVLDFFNRTDLAGSLGEGNLSDAFEIRSMVVDRIVYDEAIFGPRPR